MTKIAVIGAGAAGLSCAIMLKHKNKDLSITVYESNDRVGKKLSTTGNGRCNITNINLSVDRYHGDSEFAQKILAKFDYNSQKSFFERLGVPFVIEEDGKVYPMSLQASSVVDALRFEAQDLHINIELSKTITSVIKVNDKFKIEEETYDAVVIATGGKAGGKNIQTVGYDILKKFGHKIEPLYPSLVQLKTDTSIIKQLKGIKIKGSITIKTLTSNKTESGEILFCDYGISGPPVLQVSRLANEASPIVTIDFLPNISKTELLNMLTKRINMHPNRNIAELFTGFLNKRIGQVMSKLANCNLNDKCTTISKKQLDHVCSLLKEFELNVIGTNGFENSQVTAGGAQTNQFFDNLMSKKAKGLFAVGEILNVDGDCGGFNLAFAWASASVASDGIVEFIENRK